MKKYEAYNYYKKSAEDFLNFETDTEKAKRLLEEAKEAITRLEELGPNYAVWQNAQSSHKILKKVCKDLKFVG
tara:strand:- start:7402 stop:7620 length:219 start_codon:yes stop_codon:yes gene_type:complete